LAAAGGGGAAAAGAADFGAKKEAMLRALGAASFSFGAALRAGRAA